MRCAATAAAGKAPPPDEDAAFGEFCPFVARWGKVLNPAFRRIADFRKKE